MKVYQSTTQYNCGIDLHARCMYICVMNKEGKILVHKNIKHNNFDYFLKVVKPYRHDLTVACESTFNWYWLADACAGADIKFVLGHALYMKAIHGTKSKNDRVDSEKIAHLLRSNLLPEAYTCRPEIRPIRDLMRRRIHFVRQRSKLLSHMSSAPHVDGLDPLTSEEKRRPNRRTLVPERFEDPMRKLSLEADTYLAEQYDQVISKLEWQILKETRTINGPEFNRLQTIPGLGKTSALVILYEVDTIDRFKSVKNFCSYSRLITADAESAGKPCGVQGRKMGNAYLKWIFTEVAVHCKRHDTRLNCYFQILEAKHGRRRANRIIAHKMGRAVYYMLKRKEVFDYDKFLGKYKKRCEPTKKEKKEIREMAVSL